MGNLEIGHLTFVGAGEFDTSYAPIEYDDGRYHIKCVVNYGSFLLTEQYREGGILWSITDTETKAEIRLIAQEGDARLILFAEDREKGEQASTEYALIEGCHAQSAKDSLIGQLRAELDQVADRTKWEPIMEAAGRNIDMEATLEGLGYSPERQD